MKKNKLIIFLDPAHGEDVAGKRSPDGKHLEYIWSREVCNDMKIILQALGYEVHLTNTTTKEIGLGRRVKFVEDFITDKCKVFISPHNNAAGMGDKWEKARGFEIWTSKGHTKADILAELMFQAAKEWFPTIKHRYAVDADFKRDKEGNLAVVKSKNYEGVLLEWGFQDNIEDVKLLQNKQYNKMFVDAMVDAIEAFNDTL